MKVNLDKHLVAQLRSYFAENDKTPFEQRAFKVFDDALKEVSLKKTDASDAEQKAQELIQRFDLEVRDADNEVSHTQEEAIQCAIICVDEIQNELGHYFHYDDKRRFYYREVKQELENL